MKMKNKPEVLRESLLYCLDNNNYELALFCMKHLLNEENKKTFRIAESKFQTQYYDDCEYSCGEEEVINNAKSDFDNKIVNYFYMLYDGQVKYEERNSTEIS